MLKSLILFFSVLGVALWNSQEGFWYSYCFGKWAVLLTSGLMVFFTLKFHWSIKLYIAYALLNTMWIVAFYNSSPYQSFALIDRLAISKESLFAALTIVIFTLVFSLKGIANPLVKIIQSLCLVSIFYTLSQYDVIPFQRVGVSGNASMNGCLIAITLPFFRKWYVWVLGIIAILMTNTSVPIGVLCVSLGALLSFQYKKPWLLLTPIPFLVLGYLLQGAEFISPAGRFSMWQVAYDWWKTQNIWLGTGTGTGIVMIPYVQKTMNHMPGEIFMWLHNDWLQVLFEQGVVGLVLVSIVFIFALVKAWTQPRLIASLLGFSACALFNYPCRLPLHAFVGAAILYLIHKGDEHGEEESS